MKKKSNSFFINDLSVVQKTQSSHINSQFHLPNISVTFNEKSLPRKELNNDFFSIKTSEGSAYVSKFKKKFVLLHPELVSEQ